MDYKPELLCPVGSMEALTAAVQNGADAVYMGGQKFNARQYASNFDRKALKQAVEYAHLRGVRVYITVNILVADSELKGAVEYLEYLYHTGVDAVIVQDLGIAALAKKCFPGLEVHASTQMTIYDPEGAIFLRDVGIDRVVAARELNIGDAVRIKKVSGLTVEVFVQGALCMSYSGQCLMSSIIGGRSGNRGKCAQPCRKWYSIVDRDKGSRVCRQGYLLSPRDLFTLDNMDRLLDAGIDSFKIEGRMKRPEYVAAATRVYREAIDNYLSSGNIGDTARGKDILLRVFNRGFTKGYILSAGRQEFLSGDRPDNRGVPVGRVVQSRPGRVAIKLDRKLNHGDGIEIDTGKVKAGTGVAFITVEGQPKEKGLYGQVVEIDFTKPAVAGSVVCKTYDRELMESLASSYKTESRKVPVYCSAAFKKGMVPEIRIWDDKGSFVSVRGERKVEAAVKMPMDGDRISEQLAKTGATPYTMEQIDMDVDCNIYVPVSDINTLRRQALEELSRIRVRVNRPDAAARECIREIESRGGKGETAGKSLRLTVETGNPELINLFAESGADMVVLRCSGYEDCIPGAAKPGIRLCVKLPVVTDQQYMQRISGWLDRMSDSIKVIEASNPGQLVFCRELADSVEIYAGQSFNLFNSLSVSMLEDWRCSGAVLSPELTLRQVKDIVSRVDTYCEVAVQGRLRLMTIRYPVLGGLQEGKYGLMDKKGYVFPVYKDQTGRTEVSNSQPLFMLDRMEEIIATGIGGIRLIHHDEDAADFAYLVENYRRAEDGESYDRQIADRYIKNGITRGHFYRGV